MLKYIKKAFFLRMAVPGLGAVPLNILALLVVGVFGLAEPGLWLMGAGLELLYLLTLGTSKRFQRVVDAADRSVVAQDVEKRRLALEQPRRLGDGQDRLHAALEFVFDEF